MTDDASLHFQEVAQNLADSAPAGWIEAKVSSAIESETLSTSEYDYIDSNGDEHWFDPNSAVAAAVGRNLRAVRALAVAAGQAAWSRCTFTLSKDGAFKFDVAYDN